MGEILIRDISARRQGDYHSGDGENDDMVDNKEADRTTKVTYKRELSTQYIKHIIILYPYQDRKVMVPDGHGGVFPLTRAYRTLKRK